MTTATIPQSFLDWLEVFQQPTQYYTYETVNGPLVYALTVQISNWKEFVRDLKYLKCGTNQVSGLKCGTCDSNLRVLVGLRGPNGGVFQIPPKILPQSYNQIHTTCHSPIYTITGIKFITNNSIFPEEIDGFRHFNSWSNVVCDVDDYSYTEREELVTKYYPLVWELFSRNGVCGIHASMDLLLERLPHVNYGSALVGHGRWFRRHVPENFWDLSQNEKAKTVIEAILDASYDKGDNGWVMQSYHQINNTTLNVMASANNITSLEKMLEQLLHPDKYLRRQKEASENSIKIALTKLGDFTNTLMTYKQAIQHGAIPLGSSCSSTNFGVAAGLANRCSSKTLLDLMENMPTQLQVNVTATNHFVAACQTTLKDQILYDWLWTFYNGSSPSKIGLNGWVNVKAILPLPNGIGFIVICDGSKVTPDLMVNNFCIEEFLAPSHIRDCGTTFAELNKTTKMVIPNNENEFVLGVGLCVSTGVDTFIQSLKMRVEGREFLVERLGGKPRKK
jgi:hypothetical protein